MNTIEKIVIDGLESKKPATARPRPKNVTITAAQTKEAFGLYLDFLFDAPHGTYKIKEWGTAFGNVDLSLEQT